MFSWNIPTWFIFIHQTYICYCFIKYISMYVNFYLYSTNRIWLVNQFKRRTSSEWSSSLNHYMARDIDTCTSRIGQARHRADETLRSHILEFIAKSGERPRTQRKHAPAICVVPCIYTLQKSISGYKVVPSDDFLFVHLIGKKRHKRDTEH